MKRLYEKAKLEIEEVKAEDVLGDSPIELPKDTFDFTPTGGGEEQHLF